MPVSVGVAVALAGTVVAVLVALGGATVNVAGAVGVALGGTGV